MLPQEPVVEIQLLSGRLASSQGIWKRWGGGEWPAHYAVQIEGLLHVRCASNKLYEEVLLSQTGRQNRYLVLQGI